MYLVLLFCFVVGLNTTCVNDFYQCAYGLNYVIANRRDCSRFVTCAYGRPSYFQCRQRLVYDFCVQKCVPARSAKPQFECYNASLPGCVIQVDRPYDPLQAPALTNSNAQSNGASGYGSNNPWIPYQGNTNYPTNGMTSSSFNDTLMGLMSPWSTFSQYPQNWFSPYPPSIFQPSYQQPTSVPVSPCVPSDPWPTAPTTVLPPLQTLPLINVNFTVTASPTL
ncbi:unnamed protein product [Caenorhabditis auriculariae]|uniref:Chitin-binding type-2 domain-containing protein n=1 Tax=Caenorhabditis auriculariae TaxID=2777116 RepID=A0A8S1HIW7_9PELO|nr:unnamed protein product [Caenorhabditis auriculariae]